MSQYSPVQPSTAQYFLVNVQVKWRILPLCIVSPVPALLPLLTGDAVAEPQDPAPRPQRARGQAEEGRRGGGAGSWVLRHYFFYLFLW